MNKSKHAFVVPFDAEQGLDVASVGGKVAGLVMMTRAGVRVPPGFAVTTAAYRQSLGLAGLEDPIAEALSAVDRTRPATLDDAAARIDELLARLEVTREVAASIARAYEELSTQSGAACAAVAVRSSATAEDLPTGSFAGEYETFLDVQGAEAVCQRVLQCWQSLFSRRAIDYSLEHGLSPLDVSMAVVVQKMVRARSAGVMFTLSPVTGDRSRILVEASWGLGVAVVGGEVTPDRFTFDKIQLQLIESHVATKVIEYAESDRARPVPPDRQTIPCVSEDELRELAAMGKRLEKLAGRAQDIEWAIDSELGFPDCIVLLQCRPETVWSQQQRGPVFDQSAGVTTWIASNLTRSS